MLEYKKIIDTADPIHVLEEVFAIDKEVYSPELCGTFENLKSRYEKCKDSFVLVYEGEELAGYITFIPMGDALYAQMSDPDFYGMRDDDIAPEEMNDWCEGAGHNLFVLSIAVKPKFQGGGTVKVLASSLLAFLREKEEAGYRVDSISGTAVSGGGAAFLQRLHACHEKDVEHGYKYYRATRPAIERLLTRGLIPYQKSYDNDIFFFLPMTEVEDADGDIFELLRQAQPAVQEDSYEDIYCKVLDHHVEYECNILDSHELERVYLGEFRLACYDDDYEREMDEEEEDAPLYDFDYLDDPESGKQYFYAPDYPVDPKERTKKRVLHAAEKVHLFVTAHKKTGIYIVSVALPNNRYIPTQLIDQMSTEHLDILIEQNGEDVLVPITAYMEKHFSLVLCGESKCVVCLSQEPKSRTELGYLLSGETYVSAAIDYRIRPERLEKFLPNRAYYDYYDSYISRSVIAFIFKEYSKDFKKRLEEETSELFIVEVVLLQNTAVVRTNRHVAAELSESDGISSREIERLYLEFGRTIKFWRSDVFKYPGSQLEADEVVRSFGIEEALEEYYRNQSFLDRLVEIRGTIAVREARKVSEKAQEESERASKRMNDILYILACIESVSIIVGAVAPLVESALALPETSLWAVGLEAVMSAVLGIVAFIGYKFIYRRKIDKKYTD